MQGPRPTRRLIRNSSTGAIALRGAVIDLWGNPLGGLRIVAHDVPDEALGTSGADGRFVVRVARLPVTLSVRAPGYGAVRTAAVAPGEEGWDHWLVAAPAVDLSGRVVDEHGRAVAQAQLEVVFDDEAFVELPVLADLRTVEPPAARTDSDGRFVLRQVATGRGIRLRTRHPSFAEDLRSVPTFPIQGMRIELARPALPLHRLAGVVEDEAGARIRGALVTFAGRSVRTDEDGAFELVTADTRNDAALVASKRGYGRTVLLPFGEGSTALRLVLAGSPETIRGWIRDENDGPVRGWRVVADPLGASWVEAGQTGAAGPVPELRAAGFEESETLAVTAGEQGNFTIGGLRNGAYRLFAYDPQTLLSTRPITAQAGVEGVELSVDPEAFLAHVAGRVVDEDGRPVAGARVGLVLAATGCAPAASASCVSTDLAGRFHLRRVPRDRVEIRVEHPSILAAVVDPSSQPAGDLLEIRVDLLARFRVSDFEADELGVLDGAGHELLLTGPMRSSTAMRLFDGRSTVLSVPASARMLVWYRGGEERGRRELTLSPDELTELRP